MRQLLCLLLIVSVALCVENAAAPELTSNYIALNALQDQQTATNNILSNPHLQNFYHEYYSRPQAEQELKINKLASRVDKMSQKPLHPNFDVDPNTIHDITQANMQKMMLNDLAQNARELNAADEIYRANGYQVPPKRKYSQIMPDQPNALQYIVMKRVANDHKYSAPFGSNSPLNRFNHQIKSLENNVQKPLAPLAPNEEELKALRRIQEKMADISNTIHLNNNNLTKEEQTRVDFLLDRFAHFIRRLSNEIHQDYLTHFLEQIHIMIHNYHLQDQKFLSSLEGEISEAIANHHPLAMPQDSPASLNKTATIAPANKTTTAQPAKQPAQPQPAAKQPAAKQPAAKQPAQPQPAAKQPAQPQSAAKQPAQPQPAAKQPAQPAQPSAPEQAKQAASDMKEAGNTLINRSNELIKRAEIMERQANQSPSDNEELIKTLQNHIVSPPAKVSSI